MDRLIIGLLVILLVLFIVIRIFKSFFERKTVYEYQVGLLYKNGKFEKLLGPGTYWISKWTDYLSTIDTRVTNITIGAQEVLSKDNIGLKISLSVSYKIIDAAKAINEYQSYYTELYSLVQLVSRTIVSEKNAEELIEQRKTLGEQISEQVKERALELGMEIQQVDIKDIMFPSEIRKIFSEVVRAQKEGQAALERARGEQAALRKLANAARTLENNPALMNLRILQSFSSKSADGSSPNIVLGMPQGLFPLTATEEKSNGA